MRHVGIVAALPAELAPLVKQAGWRLEGEVYVAYTPVDALGVRLYAATAGMGAAAATRAFGLVWEAAGRQLDAIVSYGWAGAITCGVKPPDVYTLAEVIDARTGERFATSSPAPTDGAPLRLVTLDHVAQSNEKRPLAERYLAVLVDMEAATIGRLARAHGLEFYCIKGISDGYTDVLPNFNRFLDRQGQLRIPSFVMHAALRPQYWAALVRLGRNSREAARALAAQVPLGAERAGLVF